MIDPKRRSFLFGATAAATALIVPERKFYLLPSIREVELISGYDEQEGFWWARRTVDVAGEQWHALARYTGLNRHGAGLALARDAVMRIKPPQPPWKA